MKTTTALLWACGLALTAAHAQVTVDVVLEQEQFLRSESLPLRLRITNLSGQTLRLATEPEWLRFDVESAPGQRVARQADLPESEPFELESGKVANLKLDLMPCFDLGTPGRYSLAATVRVPQLGRSVASERKVFDIVSGTTLREVEFGVPGPGVPEARKYTIQQANFLKQIRLYVRVTDLAGTRVFRVQALGPLVGFSRPELQVDQSSHLHVLFQTSARGFLYGVVTPDGELIIRQTHDYSETRPTLRKDDNGRVFVGGGQRRYALSDLPPSTQPPPPALTNAPATNTPAPALTNPPPTHETAPAKPATRPTRR